MTAAETPAPAEPRNIPFTQFMLPRGREVEQFIKRPAAIADLADEILAHGYRFEAEMLTDYHTISLTISDPEKEEDVAFQICPNGPAVPEAVDKLIQEFKIPRRRKRIPLAPASLPVHASAEDDSDFPF